MAAKASTEAAVGDDAEAPPQPNKRPPIKLLVLAAVAVMVLGGGTAAFFTLHGKKPEPEAVAEPVKPVAFFDLPDLMVNLVNAPGDRTQYLKVKIVLELPDKAMTTEVQTVMPRVLDAFQTYLRELRPSDLDGSAGLYRLREELTRRVNLAIVPGHINAVLFKEILVQ